jgi:hypothetical protein
MCNLCSTIRSLLTCPYRDITWQNISIRTGRPSDPRCSQSGGHVIKHSSFDNAFGCGRSDDFRKNHHLQQIVITARRSELDERWRKFPQISHESMAFALRISIIVSAAKQIALTTTPITAKVTCVCVIGTEKNRMNQAYRDNKEFYDWTNMNNHPSNADPSINCHFVESQFMKMMHLKMQTTQRVSIASGIQRD